jgi:hypothetical protein
MDFYLDPGNRYLKFLSPSGQSRQILSCVAQIKGTAPGGTADSPVISLRENGEAKAFVIGRLAPNYQGLKTFEHQKAELAKYLLLAALPPQSNTYITNLAIAIPAMMSKQHQRLLLNLAGCHDYIHNSVSCLATIENVKLIPETVGAYLQGRHSGLYQNPSYNNGVLNIGGLNVSGSIFTPSGDRLEAFELLDENGTAALADLIATHPSVRSQSHISIEPSKIMDAIESGKYQVRNTADFRSVFEECRAEWQSRIVATIRRRWASQASELGQVLIVGGSAPLFLDYQAKTSGRFLVTPDPQNFALLGMRHG